MTGRAQPGWYDAGVAGQQRWWDGAAWTEDRRAVPPQPGWYDAGIAGQLRWWDGSTWTEHVQPALPQPDGRIRIRWGTGYPEASIAAAILCVVVFPIVLVIALGFLLSGDLVRGIAGLVISLAPAAFAVIGFVNAAAGFRLRRQQQAPTG